MKNKLYRLAVLGLVGGLVVAGFSPDLTPYSTTLEQAVIEIALNNEEVTQLTYRVESSFHGVTIV